MPSGYTRPDLTGEPLGEGLKVRLSRIEGLTAEDLLRTPFYFQLPPLEEFAIDGSYSWTDFDTLRLGQRSRPGGPNLRTVQFSTLFVDWNPTGAVWPEGTVPNARALSEELFEVMESGTPFELFVHFLGLRPEASDLHMTATLRSVRSVERMGEPDSRYVDVNFVEYERLTVRRNRRNKAGRDRSLPRVNKTVSHKLRKGDTLLKLSQVYYGEGGGWKRIKKANGIEGVSAGDADELAAWAKKKGKKAIKIPPNTELVGTVRGPGSAYLPGAYVGGVADPRARISD